MKCAKAEKSSVQVPLFHFSGTIKQHLNECNMHPKQEGAKIEDNTSYIFQ